MGGGCISVGHIDHLHRSKVTTPYFHQKKNFFLLSGFKQIGTV
jgi:hypothetical protein